LLARLGLLSIEEKRLEYSLEDIPLGLFRVAQRMKKIILPHKKSSSSAGPADESCWDQFLHIPATEPISSPALVPSVHEREVLKTPREDFCLLRIWRYGHASSSRLLLGE
jgi:hypothetical protein